MGDTMNTPICPRNAPLPRIPPLPQARPETLRLSRSRLQAMSDAFRREIEGDHPWRQLLVARRGQVGWFEALGKQAPATAMAHDSIFRIFSMTKPIVSTSIMMLIEDGLSPSSCRKRRASEPTRARSCATWCMRRWSNGRVCIKGQNEHCENSKLVEALQNLSMERLLGRPVTSLGRLCRSG